MLRSPLQPFVDRKEQVDFCFATAASGRGRDILVLQGPNGIGKTAVLNEVENLCAAAGMVCAHLDFVTRREYSDYPNFLSAVIDLWCQLELGTLAELQALIGTSLGGYGDLPHVDVPAVQQAVTAAVTAAAYPPQAAGEQSAPVQLAAAQQPVQINGTIGNLGAGAQAAIGANIVQVQVQFSQIVRQEDGRIREPLIRTQVTQAFRTRLQHLTQQHRTVILLDSWEALLTGQAFLKDPGAWLCDQLLSWLAQEEIANCVAIVATAEEPELGALLPRIRRMPLGPLPTAAVQHYYQQVIAEPLADEVLQQLVEISQGIPLAMNLLADGVIGRQMLAGRQAAAGPTKRRS